MGMNGKGQVVDTEEVAKQICEKREERCQNYSTGLSPDKSS